MRKILESFMWKTRHSTQKHMSCNEKIKFLFETQICFYFLFQLCLNSVPLGSGKCYLGTNTYKTEEMKTQEHKFLFIKRISKKYNESFKLQDQKMMLTYLNFLLFVTHTKSFTCSSRSLLIDATAPVEWLALFNLSRDQIFSYLLLDGGLVNPILYL